MTVAGATSPLARDILQVLKGRGYRNTLPRRTLALAIAKQKTHFTAEGLRRQLPPHVGRATVYRVLKILVEADVLCRVMLEDDELHYQLSHQDHHHHLLCVECGQSQDMMGCFIEDALASATALHGFQLSGHRLEVYGRCRDCLQAAATTARSHRDETVYARLASE